MVAREANVAGRIIRARDTAGSSELQELRRAVSDLVAVTALPAIWLGQTPQALAEGLGGALAGSLSPELLYLRLDLPWEQRTVEIVRTAANEAAISLHGAQLSAERDRAEAERADLLAREQAARFEAERAWAAAEAERRRLGDLFSSVHSVFERSR
jgi:hypothetical protein